MDTAKRKYITRRQLRPAPRVVFTPEKKVEVKPALKPRAGVQAEDGVGYEGFRAKRSPRI